MDVDRRSLYRMLVRYKIDPYFKETYGISSSLPQIRHAWLSLSSAKKRKPSALIEICAGIFLAPIKSLANR
jgi:hypothetical protein